jgi:hypothetical protein
MTADDLEAGTPSGYDAATRASVGELGHMGAAAHLHRMVGAVPRPRAES